MQLESKLPTPINSIQLSTGSGYYFDLLVKRDDLIHPLVSGNKYRKLTYFFEKYKNSNYTEISSIGGMWSNHLLASAVCCSALKIPFTAFILNRFKLPENDFTSCMRNHGANIQFIDQETYDAYESGLKNEDTCLFIPLGGRENHNHDCKAISIEIKNQLKELPDAYFLACGTGTTGAGFIKGITHACSVVIFPILNDSKTLEIIQEAAQKNPFVTLVYQEKMKPSFGKTNQDIADLAATIFEKNDILFDPLYNGKMLWHLLNDDNKLIKQFQRPCLIHTGGMMGWAGFTKRLKISPKIKAFLEGHLKVNPDKLLDE